MARNGVNFGAIHSYDDLDLILAPFVIPPAIPKTNLLDIPGGDGSLDLTEALGEVRYNDREITLKFTVNPYSRMTFDEKTKQVSNLLNGKEFNITFDRDSEWCWQGRCVVNEYAQDKMIGEITIKAIVRPYKLKNEWTRVEVELSTNTDLPAMGVTEILPNGRKTVTPNIYCDEDNCTITFGSETYTLVRGWQKVSDIALVEGNNEIMVTGWGLVVIEYQEGAL